MASKSERERLGRKELDAHFDVVFMYRLIRVGPAPYLNGRNYAWNSDRHIGWSIPIWNRISGTESYFFVVVRRKKMIGVDRRSFLEQELRAALA